MVDYVWLVLAGLRWVRLCYTKCEMLKCEKCPKESDFESEVHSNPVNGSPDNGSIRLLVQALASLILVLT